jgi:hypothetical protein
LRLYDYTVKDRKQPGKARNAETEVIVKGIGQGIIHEFMSEMRSNPDSEAMSVKPAGNVSTNANTMSSGKLTSGFTNMWLLITPRIAAAAKAASLCVQMAYSRLLCKPEPLYVIEIRHLF